MNPLNGISGLLACKEKEFELSLWLAAGTLALSALTDTVIDMSTRARQDSFGDNQLHYGNHSDERRHRCL